MGKREKRKWRPLLSPFFIVRPPGISLSPRLDGLAARPKTRGVTVFTQFLSIALRGVSAKYPSRCSSLDTCLDTVRRYLFPWPRLACKQPRNELVKLQAPKLASTSFLGGRYAASGPLT
jgi:hypothetical protein